MGKLHKPRASSLQYWPRKRTSKILPRVNWHPLERKYSEKKGLLGFICYKVSNARVIVNDLTADSMTKGKQIIVPVTILESPSLKILSIRFYKDNQLSTEVLADNLDKELKPKIKFPKSKSSNLAEVEKNLNKYDNIRLILYTQVKKTEKKKTPDMIEIGLSGTLQEKLEIAKNNLGKEMNLSDFFASNQLVDIRGVTKGYGLCGPVHRHGIALKAHKSEKGVRRPGNLAPWHPSRVTFHAPMAGQMGFFKRTHYNQKIIDMGPASKLSLEFKNYGKVKTNYLVVLGSIQGPSKRQVILTTPLRESKKTLKRNYEIIKILN